MAYTKAELIKALDGVLDDELIYIGVRLEDSDLAVDITNVTKSLCDSFSEIVSQEYADEAEIKTFPVTVIWVRGSYQGDWT